MQGKEGDHDSEINVERSDKTSFAFTLRKTSTKKRQPTQNDYNLHIDKLVISTNSILKEFVFERTGGLHMHGVLEIPKTTKMYKFRVRGWKLHLKEIWSYDGWVKYMAKERLIVLNEEEMVEDELPIQTLRRSLFRSHKVESASIADAIYAPLP